MKTLLTTLLWVISCVCVLAQQPLDLLNPRYHSYTDADLPEELYRFPTDPLIVGLIDTLVARTGHVRTFTSYAANVPAVTAVRTDSGDYLLYNQVHLNHQITENDRLALLAQGVGHLVQDHQLTPPRRAAETLAADVFVGFSLFRMGVPEPYFSTIPVLMAQLNTPPWRDRLAALLEGFQRAKYAVLMQPGSAYQGSGREDLVPGLPEFPFPPPNPSASYPITPYFAGDSDFAGADRRLRRALEANGYYEHRYFYVKNGFVLVTALEQFHHPEGSSKAEPGRWAERPVRQENFSLLEYLGALFRADPAYYRVFVFMVTDRPLTPHPKEKVSLDTARMWLSHGAVSLPPALGSSRLTDQHEVHALIYEFIKYEEENKVDKVVPSEIQGRIHLQRSGILISINRD